MYALDVVAGVATVVRMEDTWHKSSYSSAEAACVEVAWRKSSYSGGGNACVEVGDLPGHVAVRDSKDPAGRSCRSGRDSGRRS